MAVLTKNFLFIFAEGFVINSEIVLKSIEKIEFKNEIKIIIPKIGLFSFGSTHLIDSSNKQDLEHFYKDLLKYSK